jgi:hypothetical protein
VSVVEPTLNDLMVVASRRLLKKPSSWRRMNQRL